MEGSLPEGPGQGHALCALIAQSVQGEWSPASQPLLTLLARNWLRGACRVPMPCQSAGNTLASDHDIVTTAPVASDAGLALEKYAAPWR